MFTHKVKGMPDHKHETVAQARECKPASEANPAPKLYAALIGGQHSPDCNCDTYNRCSRFRESTARNWRDRFRSYCD